MHVELPDPLQVEIFRRMRPAERVAAALRMTRLVRTMILTRLRSEHPEWSEAQFTAELHRRYHERGG